MIHYRNDVVRSGVNGRALCAVARRLLAGLGEENASLSLSIVSDETIRALNRKYRGKDRSTDVLSFPMEEEGLLGDVVISVDTAKRQASDYDAPLERELERLLIHGLLHLLGHDHHRAPERKKMEAEERRLADLIGMPWPYARSRAPAR
ncbi:MAG TPA: rRNA maturation RNase YbeY [Candidatus Tyrphobacter sp.]